MCDKIWPRERQLRLLPVKPKLRQLSFTPIAVDPTITLQAIDASSPRISYHGPMPGRDSRQLLSHLLEKSARPGRVLDLGCGPKDQEACFSHLGYQYVGVDMFGEAPDIWADAHALPFRNEQFDVVFSYAVLEHLHNPFLAIEEVKRVLKPGGLYLGTVSLGEPFHCSYFHHSPWALLSLCHTSGLTTERLWSGPETLASLAQMGRYPKPIRLLLSAVAAMHDFLPFLAPRRMRWPEQEKRLDRLYRAGSICFAIRNPTVADPFSSADRAPAAPGQQS